MLSRCNPFPPTNVRLKKKPNRHIIPVAFVFVKPHLSCRLEDIGSIIENAESIPKVSNAMKNITPKNAAANGKSEIAVGYVMNVRFGPAICEPSASMLIPRVAARYPTTLNTVNPARNEVPASASEIIKALLLISDFFFRKLAYVIIIPCATPIEKNICAYAASHTFTSKRLEKFGVIKGFTALIDYRKLGYQINALTLLQVDGAHIEEVEEMLARESNVRAVYDITGEYDIAIITSFKTIEDLDRFIKRLIKIPYVKRSMTSIAFRVVKETPHVEEFIKGKDS